MSQRSKQFRTDARRIKSDSLWREYTVKVRSEQQYSKHIDLLGLQRIFGIWLDRKFIPLGGDGCPIKSVENIHDAF